MCTMDVSVPSLHRVYQLSDIVPYTIFTNSILHNSIIEIPNNAHTLTFHSSDIYVSPIFVTLKLVAAGTSVQREQHAAS